MKRGGKPSHDAILHRHHHSLTERALPVAALIREAENAARYRAAQLRPVTLDLAALAQAMNARRLA